MAYASITYTSASGTTFALTNSSGDPIEYLRQNDISVTVNGVLKTLTTDYTFNTAGTAIVLNTAVSGATVLIARTTDIADATVSFTAGSTLTAQDLNNSDKQNRFALQEFSDVYDSLRTGTGDLSTLGGFIGSSEAWTSDNAHSATTGAIDVRVDSKIDTALTTDVVAGDSITVTDNSPSSGQITIGVTNASISTAKLVDSSVTTAKIADGNVTTAKILDANVTTAKLADSNVTTAKIADSAITSAKIADGTIVAGDIAADAVTTAKILDSNVTTGKIADGAVTTAKLADSSVTSAKIVDGTIVAGDLASDSVTTAKIVDSNVTTAKINDNAVTTGKIADSAVTAIKIADGVITSAKLNAATVVTAAEQAACTPDDVTFFTTSASDGRYVNVTGDSMTGALAMGSNKITGLGAPTANADAATKQYVDTSVAAGVGDADYGDITVSGTGTVWTIDSGVVTSAKIADGTIVDGDINASAAIAGTKISPDFGSQNVTTTGTVTGASLSPSSSTAPTNGVYLPAANTVAISTNGSGRLFVNSSGQVGVGMASPGTPLNVQGIIRAQRSDVALPSIRALQISGEGGTFSLDSVRDDAQFGAIVFRQSSDGSTYTERARIDSSGRFGIGTSSPQDTLQIGADSTSHIAIANTGSTDVTSGIKWRYGSGGTVLSQILSASTGVGSNTYLTFHTSGTTERVRIDALGRVGIGTTSPSTILHVASTAPYIRIQDTDSNTGVTAQGGFEMYDSDGDRLFYLANESSSSSDVGLFNMAGGALKFGTSGSERGQFDSSGRLLVGTSSNIGSQSIQVGTSTGTLGLYKFANNDDGGEITLVNSRNASIGSHTIVNNGDFLGRIFFRGSDGSAFLRGAEISCQVDGAPGANDMPGRLVFSTTADGASSPTERMRIDNTGNVYVNKTANNRTDNGIVFLAGGSDDATLICTNRRASGGSPIEINRQISDGTLISFYQADTLEGSISVSGTTVSYSGAHLSRWSQLPNGAERTEILRGTVLSNIDEMCEWGDEENEQLNRMKVSDVEGDKNVSGVFQCWDDDDDTYTNDFYCAMTGDFIIRIGAGVTVERGDLLMSAGDGTAKPQDDDIIRSKTIAKVTSTNVSCTYDDGSYCVPCVLMAC